MTAPDNGESTPISGDEQETHEAGETRTSTLQKPESLRSHTRRFLLKHSLLLKCYQSD